MVNPITRRQILDSSKLKAFADDNFNCDENGRKLSKRVENTVWKGEIARYEQFLLFPQCFQTTCFPGASKGVIEWEWVKDRVMEGPDLICCSHMLSVLSLFYQAAKYHTLSVKEKSCKKYVELKTISHTCANFNLKSGINTMSIHSVGFRNKW